MTEEMINDTPVEEATEDFETPSESEEVESTEESAAEETVEEPSFDWTSLELKHLDDVKKLSDYDPEDAKAYFQKGMDYDRKVSKYEEKLNSPHYKWVDEYMKENGFEDPSNFVKAIEINKEKASLMADGMSEEAAQRKAEEYVNKTFGNKSDAKQQKIDEFLSWHQSKVDTGKFNEGLDVNSIPQQVLDAYEQGGSLKEAYMDYLLDDIKVKTEQNTLKKIAKNKETSTGELKPSTTKDEVMTAEQVDKKLSSLSGSARSKWIDANFELIEKSGYFSQF